MVQKLRIESKLSNLSMVENAVDRITREARINKENYGKILISVMEAVSNAIVHGNKSDEDKVVKVEMLLENNKLIVSIEDEGEGFNPRAIPDPTSPENIENADGRGIFLMKKLADEIEFNRKGNKVKMTFKQIKD